MLMVHSPPSWSYLVPSHQRFCTLLPASKSFLHFSSTQRRQLRAKCRFQKDADKVRDPDSANKNDDILQRRMAREAVIRKQEEKDAKAREQFLGQEGHQLQEEGEHGANAQQDRQEANPRLYKGLTVKNAKLDKPKSLEDITRIVLEQQQKAAQRQAPDKGPWEKEFCPLLPALQRHQEVLLGRTAMVGLFMACLWEVYFPDHPSITAQLSGFTGLPPHVSAFLLLGGIISIVVLGTFWPTPPHQSLEDLSNRPAIFVNPIRHPKRFLGIERSGLSRRDEVFHGRLAMFGFWAALIQEGRLCPDPSWHGFNGLGPGPLAQLAYYLGISANQDFYTQVPVLMVSIIGAVATYSLALRFIWRHRNNEE